ncbi:MAG: beta-mannanase [Ruminococcaceae bacterium]|nr:beta-mannanase [Oscillospiraceae bacterium]
MKNQGSGGVPLHKKNKVGVLALAIATAFVVGCSEIDYTASGNDDSLPLPSFTDKNSESKEEAPPANITTEMLLNRYTINLTDYKSSVEMESLLSEDEKPLTDIELFSGTGYISLNAYQSIELTVNVPASQHYDFTLYACGNGGTVTLISGGKKLIDSESGKYKRIDGLLHGAYKVHQGKLFTEYRVSPIYLEKGENKITLQTVNGSAFLDKLIITDADIKSERYEKAGTSIAGDEINYGRLQTMSYLKSIYGKQTLTAQYCTPNTNAEIDVIYRNTGRYPAIRCGDLMYYTKAGASLLSGKNENIDTELAIEWAKQGGMVMYSWYWYTPIGKTSLYAVDCEFDVTKTITDNEKYYTLSQEELKMLLDDGSITEECYTILCDMDSIAGQLKLLYKEDIPVLFKPMAVTDNAMYWWEKDEEVYKTLWQMMQIRFEEYHELSNLIWICPVTKGRMYPGDDYVDIIGCDIYNNSNVSNLQGMINADSLTLNTKMLALTECCFTPDPDILYRDNAMWLWSAPWSGKYLINSDGYMTGNYISVSQMKKIYNHELTIARDELAIDD